ncbi:MAG: hypothetical protein EA365_02640 [Gloeocapsa sp. DLM2.Bin57]|nr:MAG: hypothetical protein EA365_02640 [Gloeocapsa sp. DLM2.Bin57]
MAIVKYTLDPKNPPKFTEEEKTLLDNMTDEDIDYSDIPELPDEFFHKKQQIKELSDQKNLT